jgi:hypothetical protein
MEKRHDFGAFWRDVFLGLAAPELLTGERPRISRIQSPPVRTVREALRGDWMKIGEDFRRVMGREANGEG